MFSSNSFIIPGFVFKFLIHFKLVFMSGIRVQLHSLRCEYDIFPAPFIEETVFPIMSILGSLVKYSLTIYAWFYFWALDSVPLVCVCDFCQCHTVLITIALYYSLISGSVMLPALFFFLRIALASPELLWAHINFSISYQFCLFLCTAGSYQSSILYTSEYTCQSQSPISVHHHPHPTTVFPPWCP